MLRIGIGFDAHRFSGERKLMLGGVPIDSDLGLAGHSDADALLHALADALLGAAGLGDIGTHFPDSSPQWKDAPSSVFIGHILLMLDHEGYGVVNADLTVIAQRPKVAPYKLSIRRSVASLLHVPEDFVNVKATSTDMMGFVGRGEGIAAQAVVLLESK